MKVSINWIANVFATRQHVNSLIAMGCMALDYFSNAKSWDAKTNTILKMEYDLEQCAHILQKKGQIHLQNHLGQNSFVKVHLFSPQ